MWMKNLNKEKKMEGGKEGEQRGRNLKEEEKAKLKLRNEGQVRQVPTGNEEKRRINMYRYRT